MTLEANRFKPSLVSSWTVIFFTKESVETPLIERAHPPVGRVWFVPLA